MQITLPTPAASTTDPEIASRDAWLAERQTGLGGSDAAAALGYSPYKTPLQVYLEKRGEVAPEDISDKEAVIWGNVLEDAVAQEYARRNGVRVARVNSILRHPRHPWMLGNLDRRIIGARKGLEVKTAGAWAARSEQWGDSGSDEVPVWYLMQVHHYLAITGYDEFDLAVLIGGNEYRQYTIRRDLKLEPNLIALEEAFWRRVQTGDRPPISTIEDGVLKYPTAGGERQASQEIAEIIGNIQHAQAEEKAAKERVKLFKVQAMEFMGEADVLKLGDQVLATWKNANTTRLDTEALKKEMPDVYERFANRGTTRKFLLKGEK